MNKRALVALLIITTTFFLIIGLAPTTVQSDSPIVPSVPRETLNPALVAICTCESGQGAGTPQQFNPDGSVRRGKVNHSDIGMCQINAYYHEAAATARGDDIYTEQGNISYANYLYRTQGATPWNSSKFCWGAIHSSSTATR